MTQAEAQRTERASWTDLLQMINASWMSQAIYVAARLGIPDLLAQGPMKSADLAKTTETHPRALYRLMRALATLGLCNELEDGRFELSPLGSHLRTDVQGSLRHWAINWGGYLWQTWGNLLHSVRTGETGRKLATGHSGFERFSQDPEAAAVFNKAMVEFTRQMTAGVVSAYDFSAITKIVDVGGGYGELLAAILQANPKMRGMLFDLPHAIEGAKKHLAEAGVAERCEIVAGSFFESVPGGADAYILKSIIHDWDDDRSIAILKNCRKATDRRGKVLLVERLMPARVQPSAADRAIAMSDLNMMVAPGGAERSEAEYRALFNAAGLNLARIVPTPAFFNVLEALPA